MPKENWARKDAILAEKWGANAGRTVVYLPHPTSLRQKGIRKLGLTLRHSQRLSKCSHHEGTQELPIWGARLCAPRFYVTAFDSGGSIPQRVY